MLNFQSEKNLVKIYYDNYLYQKKWEAKIKKNKTKSTTPP